MLYVWGDTYAGVININSANRPENAISYKLRLRQGSDARKLDVKVGVAAVGLTVELSTSPPTLMPFAKVVKEAKKLAAFDMHTKFKVCLGEQLDDSPEKCCVHD